MRISALTVQGFRSFGKAPQTLECNGPLAVVYGTNSQGKSSFVEAIEFLLSGQTTRARLHAGSKSEFANCLRNVHIGDVGDVFVEATVEVDGKSRVVRRTLTKDIDQGGLCSSKLTVDDVEAEDVASLGIRLASPPFESPVLMQHALRFVLATTPQSRTDYLKAVLDIGDLDELNRLIASEIDGLAAPSTVSLSSWDACKRDHVFGKHLAAADTASVASIAQGLQSAVRSALENAPEDCTLEDLARLLRAESDKKQREVFPRASFLVQSPPTTEWPRFDALDTLREAKPKKEADNPAVLQLLQDVLALPDTPTREHAVDCPVCLTKSALTAQRLAQIRELLSGREKDRELLDQRRVELANAVAVGKRLREYLISGRPQATLWAEEQRKKHVAAAAQLRPEDGQKLCEELLAEAAKLTPYWDRAVEALDQASTALRGVNECVATGKPPDVQRLRAAMGEVSRVVTTLREKTAEYGAATTPTLELLKEPVERRSNTAGWRDLLRLCEMHTRIPEEAREQTLHTQLVKDAQAALKQIDSARKQLLDANFEALSDEVVRWWNLLRPEEPIRFSELRRRGGGHRFIDMKAVLGLEPESDGVERDAAGVFSDSQLNALGLAVFLARTIRDGGGFVVLDDPVPSSDAEHRETFASSVLGQLLTDGIQTIVTTHDRMLNRGIHDRHGHLSLDGYEIEAGQGSGSLLVRKSDDLASLFDEAAIALEYAPPSATGPASAAMRRLAERLAKEVVVLGRRAAGDAHASVAGITGSLGELVGLAAPYLCKDSSHPGKLKHAGTVLNPGAHDDSPPSKQDLKVVLGDLRMLRRQYCKRDLGAGDADGGHKR